MAHLVHTPYDGSRQPFTVGLAPLDLAEWIEPDEALTAHLREKARLFAADEAAVFRAEADTQSAQAEVLDLLLEHLPLRFPEVYTRDRDRILVRASGDSYRPSDWCETPLRLAARLVQEDLVLMRASPDGYRVVAAALCFPSSWSLADKFGRSLAAIHAPVPGFNDGRMGKVVARIFNNLRAEHPVWRLNWAIYGDDVLHHPEPGSLDTQAAAGRMDLFARIERQTLRRLPRSGDILFTIRVHVDPFEAFRRHPDGARLAAGLRSQLLALDVAQLAYKGLTAQRDRIAAELASLAANGAT